MKKRDIYTDILKSIAIIMIIITHDPFFVEHSETPVCVYLIDMAVPIFMFVSGKNHATSALRNGYGLNDSYTPSLIIKRLVRFLIPYSLIFCLVALLLVIFKGHSYTVASFFTDYIRGGYGPGSYYTPVMVQFVLLAPLLYHLILKLEWKGLAIVLLLNLFYEIAITLGMTCPEYARIIVRFLFLISCGMYSVVRSSDEKKKTKRDKILLCIMFVVGIVYLTYTMYLGTPHLFVRSTTTSMMSAFYIIPIIVFFGAMYGRSGHGDEKEKMPVITTVSSATYHIYLVQMAYYYIGLCRFITVSVVLRVVVSIIVCLIGGVLFYILEKKILRRSRS